MPRDDDADDADLETMLLALTADAAVPLPDYSDWIAYAERLEAEPPAVEARARVQPEPCPSRTHISPPFVDVNVLFAQQPGPGTRVRVAGHVQTSAPGRQSEHEVLLESGCRSSGTTASVRMMVSDAALGCAGDGDLVVVDARVEAAPLLFTMRDGSPIYLADAHVVAYPRPATICNYARRHPQK